MLMISFFRDSIYLSRVAILALYLWVYERRQGALLLPGPFSSVSGMNPSYMLGSSLGSTVFAALGCNLNFTDLGNRTPPSLTSN